VSQPATFGAAGVGVDRLSLSFPVHSWADESKWDRVEYRTGGGYSASAMVAPHAGGPEIMIGVRLVDGQPWGKAECNPARFYDPGGCELLPLHLVDAACVVMFTAAAELVRHLSPVAEARVKRVDVARDFRGVTQPALYVQGLAPLQRPYAKRSFVYNDPARASAQTLFVGSGAGGVRLYDQHEAYAEKGAPPGSLRWEVEARRGWLDSVGVKRVRELDPVLLQELAASRWEWSRMGTQVSGPVGLVDVVARMIADGKVSQTVGERLIGRVVMQSLGVATAGSSDSQARYNKLQREMGIVPSPQLWSDQLSAAAVGRLDFESGTEELALAG
jgi:hypothetical protein